MEKLKNKIIHSEPFYIFAEEAAKLKNGEQIDITGVNGSLLAFLAVYLLGKEKRQVVLVGSDDERAEKLRDDCAVLAGEEHINYFGTRPGHQAEILDLTQPISQIETLKALLSGKVCLIVASPNSVVQYVPPPERFSETILRLDAGAEYNFQELTERLERSGFEKKEFVEGYGDFAVRGGIIDLLPYVGENPIRLEFWGDTLESIREFDILSQRSIKELKSASVVPSLTPISSEENKTSGSTLFDYLLPEAIVILDEPEIIDNEIAEAGERAASGLTNCRDIRSLYSRFPFIINSHIGTGGTGIGRQAASPIDFISVSQPSFNGSIKLLVKEIENLSARDYKVYLTSDTKAEAERLKELIDAEITDPGHLRQDARPAADDTGSPSLSPPQLERISSVNPAYTTETIHSGFIYHPSKVALFTEHEIFGRIKRRGTPKKRRFKGFSYKELHQLRRGDYVVHVDHGIGEFAGLTKIRIGRVEQEVMKLLFLENDTLYVNLNYINRVQKYTSKEGHVPKISKLGAPDWERMKANAKRRIKDIARDLIALYARRKNEEGTAFSADTHWQKELEASFMYEDTADQAAATIDVKRDMESRSPMDRLICGDVGFGKTEVAVRSAFKAVMDGKQAAVLVPTTILAIQHHNTFLDRLSRYTTRIESITRFKSKKEQKRILDELKNGSLDVVIGTHRLLSGDIEFHDLGLLIIDEEHRFGVAAKEKLRKLKASVDTLSLTATPIPRTLHFSLIGARDLSIINSPPRNRLPIVTEIITASDGGQTHWQVIREGVLKELHRGGQIYFVHDRVQNIEAVAGLVKQHVPEARVHTAHGQMTGHELEKAMLGFLEKKYDLLVCTKIIESGLDIPSVNTIIINRADRFGLAELYQLRGRVGRSNIQAYAYLLVPPMGVLPRQTIRRLQAIEEFTELGSGFNLAMRDLEIRGAGNLLGAEQSGFIAEMGFEMYERLVLEAVKELREGELTPSGERPDGHYGADTPDRSLLPAPLPETMIDADIDALIPDFYIESDTERLDIYRRLYRATEKEELKSMRDELRDRFGEYPEEVENLFALVGLRLLASAARSPKISIKEQTMTLNLPGESNRQFYGETDKDDSPFQRLIKNIAREKGKDIRLRQAGKELILLIDLPVKNDARDRLKDAEKRLETINSYMAPL